MATDVLALALGAIEGGARIVAAGVELASKREANLAEQLAAADRAIIELSTHLLALRTLFALNDRTIDSALNRTPAPTIIGAAGESGESSPQTD